MRRVLLGLVVAAAVATGIVAVAKARRRDAVAPTAEPFVRVPAVFLADIVRSETLADQAGSSVKKTLMKGVREGDWALAASALEQDFLARLPEPAGGEEVPAGALRLRRFGPA